MNIVMTNMLKSILKVGEHADGHEVPSTRKGTVAGSITGLQSKVKDRAFD